MNSSFHCFNETRTDQSLFLYAVVQMGEEYYHAKDYTKALKLVKQVLTVPSNKWLYL